MTMPPPDAAALRSRLAALRAPLSGVIEALRDGDGQPEQVGLALGRARARALDELLASLFPRVQDAAGVARAGVVLAAVGGYGRGALALESDVDLRLLTPPGQSAQDIADRLLYPLWDAGLQVGHQVVVAEALLSEAMTDIPTATALLDWRLLSGDQTASRTLREAAMRRVFPPSRLSALIGELDRQTRQRHRRYGASVYMLEPDVKNGQGALRDLDVARWIARARWNADTLDALVKLGVILPRQLAAVSEAQELLWRIRNLLHHQAARRSDRLSFEEQERIAPLLGYAGKPGAPGAGWHLRASGEVARGAERLMSDYYRAARTLSRFRDAISERALPERRRGKPTLENLGHGLQLFDGQLTMVGQQRLREQPALALRLLGAALDHGVALRAHARQALVSVCGDAAWTEQLRRSEEAAALFACLVVDCRDTALKAGTVVRELHDVGLLVAMVPELSPLVGRVHHDTYHVYTVDVHLVAAVDRLRQIMRGEGAADEAHAAGWEGSLAYQLASEVTNAKVLFFATLLHDVGKATARHDHSARGAELARRILARLPFDATETEAVCRLIDSHLVMYRLATRRDLDDGSTIEELARATPTAEALRQLYLLTVADLSTTSPTSMTSWKAHMLDELFLATDRWVAGKPAPLDDAPARIAAAKRHCTEADAEASAAEALLEPFVAAMPRRYRSTTRPEAMAAHAAVVAQHLSGAAPATVAMVPSRRAGGAELCVVAEDRLGLLASIAAALTASRLQVHAAHIYSCATAGLRAHAAASSAPEGARAEGGGRLAVDFFWVRHTSERALMDRAVARLSRCLCELLRGEHQPAELVGPVTGGRARTAGGPAVANEVTIDNRASPRYTVVEVFTRDRRGLLYRLADALFGQAVSIARAKIATEGTRVVDVFYVSERDGKKVTNEARLAELCRVLEKLVDELDETAPRGDR